MNVTWLGHAGLRIEQDGYTLVVDPGVFCPEPLLGTALAEADGLLITHQHADHLAQEQVAAALERKPGLEVWTNGEVASVLSGAPGTVHTIGDGDAFTAGGIDVHAYGEWHAEIHRDIPLVRNTGFLIGGRIFHPGDAFTHPGVPVELLLAPLHAPWNKIAEVIDFVRDVKPARVSPIHNGLLNDFGNGLGDALLSPEAGRGPGTGAPYSRMVVGESFEL
jgi:L-ascorbate metabolism protein UlaG (beta-lactamase superfamily)